MRWVKVTHLAHVPASAGRVWALISDPARCREWDTICAALEADLDGVEHPTGPLPTTQATPCAVDHVVPGQEISWRRSLCPGQQLTWTMRAVITNNGDAGVVLNLRMGGQVDGAGHRLGGWMASMIDDTLRGLAHDIAAAATEAPVVSAPSDQEGPRGRQPRSDRVLDHRGARHPQAPKVATVAVPR